MDPTSRAPAPVSHLVLEPLSDRSRAYVGQIPSDFGIYPRKNVTRDEAHANTRLWFSFISDNGPGFRCHVLAGRGHTFESTRPLEQQEVLPPANASEANWLRQQALKQQWKTERIAQLEQELTQANETIVRQQLTIKALREQVGLSCCSLQPSPWRYSWPSRWSSSWPSPWPSP